MTRGRLAPVVLALALATSGCLGVVLGDPLSYEARPAGVDERVGARHGVYPLNHSTFEIRHEPDLPLVGTREVRIVNHVSAYAFVGDATVPGETVTSVEGNLTANVSVGTLLVVSTPRAEFLGQELNPLGRLPTRELVERVGSRTGEQDGVAYLGATTVSVLGTETTVEKYRSRTTAGDTSVETFVYVTRVEHDGDYVVAVAVLPRDLADREPALYAAMEGIRHPVEPPSGPGGPRRTAATPGGAGGQ